MSIKSYIFKTFKINNDSNSQKKTIEQEQTLTKVSNEIKNPKQHSFLLEKIRILKNENQYLKNEINKFVSLNEAFIERIKSLENQINELNKKKEDINIEDLKKDE